VSKKIRVIGFGNVLLHDDGVGIFVIEELQKFKFPNIEFINGGINGIDIISFIEGAKKVIIIDAVIGNGKIGNVYKVDLNKIYLFENSPMPLSLHEFKWNYMIPLAKTVLNENFPEKVIFYGIEINNNNIQYKVGLSQELKKHFPKIIKLILKELIG